MLERYQRNSIAQKPSMFNLCFERAVTAGAFALMWWHRFSFPERRTGGWWWISRFRFEFLAGWFEQECTIWVRKFVKPGMTVVDIGAHLGFYTRLLSKLVGPAGKVLAFEANPENFAVLRRNLRGYKNVELLNSCVADKDGSFTLYVSPGHSNHSLMPGYSVAASTLTIPGVALDSFLAGRGIHEVGFIKCDTEGAEPLVLAGMRQTLSGLRAPVVLIEYNPAAIRCGGVEPERVPEFLAGLDYEVKAIA
ncbi:MAG: FkbM family methyltransferase, partial [Terriglobia bacterium]